MKIQHIGLIPDGNRRWALENSLGFLDAYSISMQRLKTFVQTSFEKPIPSASVYMLSAENLARKREDLTAVIESETKFIVEMLPSLCHHYQCKVIHAGTSHALPTGLAKGLERVCESTFAYSKHRLYLLVGYNPVDEINSAVQEKRLRKVNLRDLWVPEPVDYVVRTAGGPSLLSNFLPLQCGYAPIFMVEKYFNDFNREDFDRIYSEATRMKMLFGK